MSVYVDTMRAPFGRMIMCHMIADSTRELLEMATTIGVQQKWLQHGGTHLEHFDISLAKRKLAIEAGAKELTVRELAYKLRERRAPQPTWTGFHPKRIQELGLLVDRGDFWVRDAVTRDVRLMTDTEWEAAMSAPQPDQEPLA